MLAHSIVCFEIKTNNTLARHARNLKGVVDDGSKITTPGFADVTYINIETVNLSVVTGISSSDMELPISFCLSNNYPNPFNPTTTIKYFIPKLSFITLKVFDVLGNEIAVLVNEEKPVGNYEVEFDASSASGGLSSGIYFYRLQVYAPGRAGDFIDTKKMAL